MGIVRSGWRAAATLALLATFLVFRAGPAFADAPPPNDAFSNATVITSTPFNSTEDTTGATAAPDDPTTCGTPANTVWYAFTPTANETVLVNASGYFTDVSAYTGTEGALNQVACGGFFSPFPTWPATAGVTYYIMVSSAFGGGGTLSFQLTVALPPANDDFDHATVISAVPYTETIDTTGATSAPDDPLGCGGTANSVWYAITPTVDETVFLSVSGGSNIPDVSAYSGAEGSLNQVACGNEGEPASWAATAGVTYHIMVVDSGPSFIGTITLQVSALTPPANDDFNNATPITSLPYSVTENQAGATTAADDPTGCGGAANSVWFSFKPTVAETITASVAAEFASVSVYAGSQGALSQVACGTGPFSSVQFSATLGTTYHIMVVNTAFFSEGPNEQFTLSITGNIPPANDDFDHATVVTNLPYTNTINAAGATAAADDPTSCGSTDNSVWYELTPKVNETIVLNTDGSTYQTAISTYTGTEGSLDQVACGNSQTFAFVAKAGVTYHVMIAANSGFSPAGSLTVNIMGFLPPPNDAIAHATVITGLPYSASEDTTGATTVPSDPACVVPPTATVWYRFTPPASGSIEARAFSSSYGTTVSAYTGSPGALTSVACGFGSTGLFPVAQGVTYYFEVSSINSTIGGDLQFSVSAVPDTPATGPCTAQPTGKITGGLTIDSGTTCLENATVTGTVTVGSGAQLLMANTTLNGSVVADGASAVAICNSSITGGVLVDGSTGFTIIGDGGAESATCGGNQIAGNVNLVDNLSGIDLGGNTIGGLVTVTNNQPKPGSVLTAQDAVVEIDANHIGRNLSCANNVPAPVNDGLVNSVAGTGTGQCAGL